MISEERAEKALRFLVETDEPCAMAKGEVERTEFAYKRTREAERQAAAAQHKTTLAAHDEYVKALQTYSHMANKRDTERIVLDVYRTISANKRMGNV